METTEPPKEKATYHRFPVTVKTNDPRIQVWKDFRSWCRGKDLVMYKELFKALEKHMKE